MGSILLIAFGMLAYLFLRTVLSGIYTIQQSERAVKTSFGRAQRIGDKTTLDDPIGQELSPDERERYTYPQVRVIQPGIHFKLPWEKVYKTSIATNTVNMAWDPENSKTNSGGTILEAVTKDQLNIGLTGQVRFRVSERNLYAFFFGVKHPEVHIMGYFVSILRERIANFQAKSDIEEANTQNINGTEEVIGAISINDLRKNLRDLNDHMVQECLSAPARYGIALDASLITGIDPPPDVESALAAINTAHNNVSSEISRAQAAADQTIVQSKRAVEIETLKAQAEVAPLIALAKELGDLKQVGGIEALTSYVRNARLTLISKASRVYLESSK